MRTSPMPITTPMPPIARRAAFKSAVIMRETTGSKAARQLGASYNHLMCVLAGERRASAALEERIAQFLGSSAAAVFGPRTAPPTPRDRWTAEIAAD
jgi:hypothetical protein